MKEGKGLSLLYLVLLCGSVASAARASRSAAAVIPPPPPPVPRTSTSHQVSASTLDQKEEKEKTSSETMTTKRSGLTDRIGGKLPSVEMLAARLVEKSNKERNDITAEYSNEDSRTRPTATTASMVPPPHKRTLLDAEVEEEKVSSSWGSTGAKSSSMSPPSRDFAGMEATKNNFKKQEPHAVISGDEQQQKQLPSERKMGAVSPRPPAMTRAQIQYETVPNDSLPKKQQRPHKTKEEVDHQKTEPSSKLGTSGKDGYSWPLIQDERSQIISESTDRTSAKKMLELGNRSPKMNDLKEPAFKVDQILIEEEATSHSAQEIGQKNTTSEEFTISEKFTEYGTDRVSAGVASSGVDAQGEEIIESLSLQETKPDPPGFLSPPVHRYEPYLHQTHDFYQRARSAENGSRKPNTPSTEVTTTIAPPPPRSRQVGQSPFLVGAEASRQAAREPTVPLKAQSAKDDALSGAPYSEAPPQRPAGRSTLDSVASDEKGNKKLPKVTFRLQKINVDGTKGDTSGTLPDQPKDQELPSVPPKPQEQLPYLQQLPFQQGHGIQRQQPYHHRHPMQLPSRPFRSEGQPLSLEQQRPLPSPLGETPLNQRRQPSRPQIPPGSGPQQRPLSGGPQPISQQQIPPQQGGPQYRQQAQRPTQEGANRVPAWKRLWRRVEDGLDSLADLEDVVSGRAKQLYETASSAIKKPHRVGKSRAKKGVSEDEDGDDSDVEPDLLVTSGLRQPPRRPINQRPDPRVPHDQSLIGRHTLMRQQQEQNLQHREQQGSGQVQKQASAQTGYTGNEKIDWNAMGVTKPPRPVVANGGASPVPGDSNHDFSKPPYMSTPQQQPRPPQSTGFPSHVYQPPTPPQQAAAVDTAHRKDVRAMLSTHPMSREGPGALPLSAIKQVRPSPRLPFEDEEESQSWKQKLARLLPPIPSFNFFWWRENSVEYASTLDAWDAEDSEKETHRGIFGLWAKKKADGSFQESRKSPYGRTSPPVTPIVSALMDRFEQKEAKTLLKESERKQCISLGRQQAIFDLAALVFLLYAFQEFANIDPGVAAQSAANLAEAVAVIGKKLLEGWFRYAVFGAVLSFLTNGLLLQQTGRSIANRVGNQIMKEAEYGALFLRLASSASTKRSVVDQVRATGRSQCLATIESARLRTFVICLLGTLVLMTLSFVRPLLLAIIHTVADISILPEWRAWPVKVKPLLGDIQSLLGDFLHFITSAVGIEIRSLAQHPLRFAYDASLFVVLLLISCVPTWEMGRSVQGLAQGEDGSSLETRLTQTSRISNLGTSSATRLQLVSKRSSLDEVLERWRTSVSDQNIRQIEDLTSGSSMRQAFLGIVSGILLSLPLIVYGYCGITGDLSQVDHIIRWDSLRDVAVVLIYTQILFLLAVARAVDVSSAKRWIVRFQSNFISAVNDRTKQLTAPPANLQLQASISLAAGIIVRDLWAAHATRRSWGVRGANLWCRSGEVVMVLGDDGSGKSRLLTTIAESIFMPPKQAQTATRVRGTVSVGGLDVTKWDPNQLRRRVGLMLNDVRTIADFSQAFTGLTLEEILEPGDGTRTLDPSHAVGSNAKACMITALKITGLYSTLLPRLPSKLSTVVTGSEEDLNPSPLRPHYTLLSQAEWAKLLLARVLCQSIYDNENAVASNDKVEKSMIGTVLLLDDVTVQCSEAEEGRLIQNLRSSAAATLVTSNRWALGRWADRVVVLKDGAVVETGTHVELLNNGPQQSTYAAKWHAMTSI